MDDIQIGARSAFLVDGSGSALFEKNASKRMPMASLAKLMTALCVVQKVHDLHGTTVTVSSRAVALQEGNEDSSAALVEGEILSVNHLLYGMLLPSGNDAAVALIESVFPSHADFVHLMHWNANHFGLYDSHFSDGIGLDDDGQYTTAYDMVQLTDVVFNQPAIPPIVKSHRIIMGSNKGGHVWTNTNKLLNYHIGCIGVKTGTTDKAGCCLVFAAKIANRKLLGCILDADTDEQRYNDAIALLDWGFTR